MEKESENDEKIHIVTLPGGTKVWVKHSTWIKTLEFAKEMEKAFDFKLRGNDSNCKSKP